MDITALLNETTAYFDLIGGDDTDREFALIPEGTIRRINGKEYRLTSSRWRSVKDHDVPNAGERQKLDFDPRIKLPDTKADLDRIKKAKSFEKDYGMLDTLSRRYDGLAKVAREKELPEEEIDRLEAVSDRAAGKRDRLQAQHEGKELLEEMERTQPFSSAMVDGALTLTAKPREADMFRSRWQYDQRSLSISPHEEGALVRDSGQQLTMVSDKPGEKMDLMEGTEVARRVNGVRVVYPPHEFVTSDPKILKLLGAKKLTQAQMAGAFEVSDRSDAARAAKSTISEFAQAADPIDRLQDADLFRPWLDQLGQLEGSSLEEIGDMLDRVFPDLDSTEFREAMITAYAEQQLEGMDSASD